MQENRDPAIKLFGMEIPVSSGDGKSDSGDELVQAEVETSTEQEEEEEEEELVEESDKETVVEKVTEVTQEDDTVPSSNEEETNSGAPPDTNMNPKTPSMEEEISKSKVSDPEKEPNEATNSQEKILKKPDKILPCPRCKSMDTKFCYYNNYNVNQPRHFCKACQRYWTAGGTMRNVPVGAGRRKSKNSSSNYRHISISEALQAARIDVPNGSTHPALKTNGGVLSFSYDAPICKSMASVLNLADKKVLNGTINGFHNFHGVPIPSKGGENGDDCSSGSSVTISNSMEEGGRNPQESVMGNINGVPAQMPCLSGPGILWPYAWTSAVPPPVFCPPGFPMPFHPAAYWNCSVPTPWNIPWLSPHSPPSQKSPRSGPSSPLGKHSRDGKMLKPDGSEEEEQPEVKTTNGCVLVPKTLRIDDPAEAAKSSIWATLGIKNESISGGRMFKGFQSKKDEKNHAAEPSLVLQANPAALSRSLNFQESV